MERRINPRFEVRLFGAFTWENRGRQGIVADISASGCKFSNVTNRCLPDHTSRSGFFCQGITCC